MKSEICTYLNSRVRDNFSKYDLISLKLEQKDMDKTEANLMMNKINFVEDIFKLISD